MARFYNSIQKQTVRFYGLLLLAYIVAHGGIIFSLDALFWDDWVIHDVSSATILNLFDQAGSFLNLFGHLHNTMLSVGPWLYRFLTLSLFFVSGVLLNLILKNYPNLSTFDRFIIVLLFLILPMNLLRTLIITFSYTLSHFLFFTAWALLGRKNKLSAVLFFFSFTTNSLLVFYAVPFIEYYNRSARGRYSLRSFFIFCSSNWLLFIAPFLFWGIKISFFQPFGLYEGYNSQFDILGSFRVMVDTIKTVSDLKDFVIPAVFFMPLAVLLIHFSKMKIGVVDTPSARLSESFFVFVAGIFVTIAGVFPYAVIGSLPAFGLNSRNQLLMPLGLALMAFSLYQAINYRLGLILLSLIVSISLAINISTYHAFYIEGQKHKMLIQKIATRHEIRSADIVAFEDRTKDFNAYRRSYAFYEWSGILSDSFGDSTRFGVEASELDSFDLTSIEFLSAYEQYRFQDFQIDRSHPLKRVLVIITLDHQSPSPLQSARGMPNFDISVRRLSDLE